MIVHSQIQLLPIKKLDKVEASIILSGLINRNKGLILSPLYYPLVFPFCIDLAMMFSLEYLHFYIKQFLFHFFLCEKVIHLPSKTHYRNLLLIISCAQQLFLHNGSLHPGRLGVDRC